MPRAHLFNETTGERFFFNEEERKAFIETAGRARDDIKTFCSLLHYTGCNFTEALNFLPHQVDFEARAITFPRPHHSKISRSIPVPDSFIELLDEVHGVRRAASGLKADQKLWPLSKMAMHNHTSRVIAEAGITGGPHALPKGIRHGFFVHALRSRVMITRLQRWMGHSFPEYTAAFVSQLLQYAPELLGDEREDAERMW